MTTAAGAARTTARAELVLARDPVAPLRDVPLEPDPLTSLAAAAGDLWDDETLEVVVDLVPVTPGAQRRWRNRAVKKHQADPGGGGGGWAAVGRQLQEELARGSARRPPSRQAAPLRRGSLERRAVDAKERRIHQLLSRDEPHFLMQLLIRATSPIPGRPPAILQSALGAFDMYAGGENWLRAKGARILGRYLAADAFWSRRGFDARFDEGRVRPPTRNRVGATTIAGLLKPPTKSCAADNVIRSDGLLPQPPPNLPRWRRDAGLWPLGVVRSRRDEDYLAAAPLDDTLFTLTTGAAQYGKTESALGRIMATVDAGHGVMFIDPHGDAVERIKPYLVDKADRVLELALELGQTQQAGWNPFAIDRPDELEERMTSITDSLAAGIGWRHGVNNRALGITLNAVRTLLELSLHLPADIKPTVFQLTTLLASEDWRAEVVERLSPQSQSYWERFAYKPAEFTPLMSLVDRLRTARSISALLGAPVSTFDLRREMDRGGVVLVRLRGTGDLDKLLASLLVYGVLEALLSRRDTGDDERWRKPFHVWVDEAQIVDAAVRRTLSSIAEQTRKFGGRMHLLTQAPERLSDLTMTSLMTNRSHLITTSVSAEGAKRTAREWAAAVNPATIQRLPKYQFVGQVRLDGQRSEPFRIGGVHLDELWGDRARPDELGGLDEAIARNTGYQPVAGALETLDDLDGRILTHLREGGAAAPQPSPATISGDSPYRPDRVRAVRQGE